MQVNKLASLILLLALSSGLGACASQPHPTASPTVPAASSATTTTTTPSTQPTPTPTHSPIGPEGTVLIQDGKVWLESKNGTYTIDIPEGYVPDKHSDGVPYLQSSTDEQAGVDFTHYNDLSRMPSMKEAEESFHSSLLTESQIRKDITKFAESPALTIQSKVLPLGENDRPDYDGTTLHVLTDIGDTRWGLGFSAASREEVEALMQQAADSLTKQ